MSRVTAKPLTAQAFAPFGDVLEIAGAPDRIINQGLCGRYHDRARLDFGPGGRAGLSRRSDRPRRAASPVPASIWSEGRPPRRAGQAFIPMHGNDWLVIVAEPGDSPGPVHGFIAGPGQGINLHRGTWHGVLTPLHAPGVFAVVDRIGDTANLQEYKLDPPVLITGA